MADKAEDVCHTGGCHCGTVRFKVLCPAVIKAIDCNCSICVKKQLCPFVVPEANFEITKGKDNLTTYTFNLGIAKHMFCKTCGVQCFYKPRACPDGFGVVPHCLDPGTVERIDVEKFDGQNFEEALAKSDISSRTKAN